jgi:hypothetical protein
MTYRAFPKLTVRNYLDKFGSLVFPYVGSVTFTPIGKTVLGPVPLIAALPQPSLPIPVTHINSVYGTGLYTSRGLLSLSLALTPFTTSVVLAYAAGAALFTTTNLPVTILIDNEKMTVTAVSGSPQTLTVTRAVGGTTAVVHASSALVEVAVQGAYT